MRKIYQLLTALLISVWLFAGQCSAASVVATIFPVYDWVREISAGTGTSITLLLDSGVDLHSFQPSAQDIVKISSCDLFIYVGGESDEWADDVLKNIAPNGPKVINLLDVLGDSVKPEEIVEGMEHEHGHEHEHEEPDEHVWLSLKNAVITCRKISEVLCGLDPKNKNIFTANLENYIRELSNLDKSYAETIENSKRKVILFGDRFPFRYLTDDYGLKYYAAFSGCSAESEASFETVIFLAKKVEELSLPCVLTIDGTRHKIAQTVISSTKAKNQRILVLDSMQSSAMKDIQEGKTYLSAMKRNLEILKEALN